MRGLSYFGFRLGAFTFKVLAHQFLNRRRTITLSLFNEVSVSFGRKIHIYSNASAAMKRRSTSHIIHCS